MLCCCRAVSLVLVQAKSDPLYFVGFVFSVPVFLAGDGAKSLHRAAVCRKVVEVAHDRSALIGVNKGLDSGLAEAVDEVRDLFFPKEIVHLDLVLLAA